MRTHSLRHLSDRELVRGLVSLDVHERTTIASHLAHLAEVDARRLYLPAAYPLYLLHCGISAGCTL